MRTTLLATASLALVISCGGDSIDVGGGTGGTSGGGAGGAPAGGAGGAPAGGAGGAPIAGGGAGGVAAAGAGGAPVAGAGGSAGGGPPDAGVPDTLPIQWGLSYGTNNFKVLSTAAVTDGCMIDPAALVGMTLPVTYQNGVISIGNLNGLPPMPSLGAGMASGNSATLTRENDQGDVACTYHRRDVSRLELVGHDTFTLAVREDESMFMGCGTDVPPGGACTSTWTWTMQKQ